MKTNKTCPPFPFIEKNELRTVNFQVVWLDLSWGCLRVNSFQKKAPANPEFQVCLREKTTKVVERLLGAPFAVEGWETSGDSAETASARYCLSFVYVSQLCFRPCWTKLRPRYFSVNFSSIWTKQCLQAFLVAQLCFYEEFLKSKENYRSEIPQYEGKQNVPFTFCHILSR